MNTHPMIRIVRIVAYVGIVVVCIMALSGCAQKRDMEEDTEFLPSGATNIEHVGNGWYTFDVMTGPAAGCYLIYQRTRGYRGWGFLTQRPCG